MAGGIKQWPEDERPREKLIRHGADTREVAIDFQGHIICGKFVDEEKPTFTEAMDEHYRRTLGDRYVPMSREGGWIHE